MVTLKSSLMKPFASRCSKAAREGYTIHCGFLPLATPNPWAIDETEPVRSVSMLVRQSIVRANQPWKRIDSRHRDAAGA